MDRRLFIYNFGSKLVGVTSGLLLVSKFFDFRKACVVKTVVFGAGVSEDKHLSLMDLEKFQKLQIQFQKERLIYRSVRTDAANRVTYRTTFRDRLAAEKWLSLSKEWSTEGLFRQAGLGISRVIL